jgi:hypothetical protein
MASKIVPQTKLNELFYIVTAIEPKFIPSMPSLVDFLINANLSKLQSLKIFKTFLDETTRNIEVDL